MCEKSSSGYSYKEKTDGAMLPSPYGPLVIVTHEASQSPTATTPPSTKVRSFHC